MLMYTAFGVGGNWATAYSGHIISQEIAAVTADSRMSHYG
jgi:hypothetical protein